MNISVVRRTLSHLRTARAWRPSALTALTHGVASRQRNEVAGYTDLDHLRAAVQWLQRAQDASSDGGVAGRYTLSEGWTSSYPETTGYIIPTLLALESDGFVGCRERAARCVDFLLSVQLPTGAFPGMEIAQNRDEPSVFNTAQILNGLTAWHRATQEERVLVSARRAADWLVEMQDADGGWRKHLYGNRTYTYMAHAGCWIAEFGAYTGDQRYIEAARSHLRWVLSHVDTETGWINDCGFGDDPKDRSAVTHTIAYTIWGILLTAQIVGHEEGIAVARRASHAVARRLEVSHRLPGKLDWRWRAAASYTCLTGNAQMALIWIELHRLDGDPALLSAACKAIDVVKAAQPMTASDPGIRGGIAGSDPVWGDYIQLAYPNWAAKFFIDALLAKRKAIAELTAPIHARGVPHEIPIGETGALSAPTPHNGPQLRTVLLASERSPKVEQFVDAWSSWGYSPTAVICVSETEPDMQSRILTHVRDYGVGSLFRRALGRPVLIPTQAPRQGTIPTSGLTVVEYCKAKGIPTVTVNSLAAPDDLERIRSLNADLFIYAGCGIMRPALLALARLGTLNAHMGVLPAMRGMNVTEWSVLCRAPVGCTVHLIDPGIDTGDIIVVRLVDPAGAENIDTLRQRVDRAQISLLGDVVRWSLSSGTLPPRHRQRADEGRQYFVMHTDVREALQRILARSAV